MPKCIFDRDAPQGVAPASGESTKGKLRYPLYSYVRLFSTWSPEKDYKGCVSRKSKANYIYQCCHRKEKEYSE